MKCEVNRGAGLSNFCISSTPFQANSIFWLFVFFECKGLFVFFLRSYFILVSHFTDLALVPFLLS